MRLSPPRVRVNDNREFDLTSENQERYRHRRIAATDNGERTVPLPFSQRLGLPSPRATVDQWRPGFRCSYLCTWTRPRRRTGWRRRPPAATTDTFVRPPDTRIGKLSPCNGVPVRPSWRRHRRRRRPSSASSAAIPRRTPIARKRPARNVRD